MYVANSGAFIAKRRIYLKENNRICKNPLPIINQRGKGFDIDDINDFRNFKEILKSGQKLYKIVKKILASKLIFKSPKRYDMIIFDSNSLSLEKYLLKNQSYFILINRYQDMKFFIIRNYYLFHFEYQIFI